MAKDYAYLLKDLERAENRTREKVNPDQKLSLCMIVKNEEKYLEGALESVQGIVDEIIIVDTGSTDSTVEIARKYGAQVHFRPWDDDFAAARNESLKHATGQWVLIMDADERIPESVGSNLRSLLVPTDQPISYLTYIKNYMLKDDESSVLGHYVVRVFRKTAETRFFGAIHEQLYPNWGHVTIPEESFHIVHLGYGDLQKKEAKIQSRNIPMIKKALEQVKGKNDDLYSFYAYYMGASISHPKEVVHWMQESIDSCSDPVNTPHIQVAYLELLKAHYYARDYAAGIVAAEKGLDRIPSLKSYPDFLEFIGILYTADRQFEKALDYFQQVLALAENKDDDSQVFFTVQSSRIGSWGTWFNMLLAANGLKDQEQAEQYAQKALETYPDKDKSPIIDRIDRVMGESSISESFFEEMAEDVKQDADHAKMLSNHYLKQEKPFEAVVLQSQLHDAAQVIKSGTLLAQQYLEHQRYDLAQKTFEGLLSLDDKNFNASVGLYLIQCQQQEVTAEPEKLAAFFEQAESAEDFAVLGDLSLRFGLLEQAQQAFEKLSHFASHHYDAQLQLALIEQAREDVQAAMLRLRDLLTAEPERVDAYVQLGNIMVMYGQFEQAQELFEIAIRREQGNWYNYYGFALALAGQENFDTAERALAMAARLSPNQGNVVNLYYLIQEAKQQGAEGPASEAMASAQEN